MPLTAAICLLLHHILADKAKRDIFFPVLFANKISNGLARCKHKVRTAFGKLRLRQAKFCYLNFACRGVPFK
ncbi:hypothetical protein EDS67_09060 [candidate division KSB1 bacterium]|nr:MAG: hypothetical protein EDS67_09060 [candidate division KSB1 bacterium]MBC6946394.1 hypothetical protein [candidate division KSB1 bacterium]MCE7941483.1 hypothetical protein [Chlorobi bacterium CHB1]